MEATPRDFSIEEETSSINDCWAVIVGVSEYVDESLNLKYAAADASAFYELITGPLCGYKPENIRLLIDEQATKANIEDALFDFLQQPASDDVVCLYFACHGAPDPRRTHNIYLLPHETDKARIGSTAIRMGAIDQAIQDVHAKRIVVLADTCHSAAIASGTRSGEGNSSVDSYLKELSKSRPGVAMLTSAESAESALEGPQWGGGHGAFTHYILEGMRGAADYDPQNGLVTIGELFEYVRAMVEKDTDGKQHPSVGNTSYDRQLLMSQTGAAESVTRFSRSELEFGKAVYASEPAGYLQGNGRTRSPGWPDKLMKAGFYLSILPGLGFSTIIALFDYPNPMDLVVAAIAVICLGCVVYTSYWWDKIALPCGAVAIVELTLSYYMSPLITDSWWIALPALLVGLLALVFRKE